MAIVGSAYVEIHAIDKFLQHEIDAAVKKIKDPVLEFQADIDLKPVRAKIKALRSELKAAPLQLKIDANYEEVLDNIDAIRHQQENDDVHINFNPQTDVLETALESIQNRFRDVQSTVNANADTAAAEAQLSYVARNRRSNISVNVDPETRKALEGLLFTLVGALPADKIKGALTGVASNFESLAIMATGASAALGALSASVLTAGANLLGIAGDLVQVGGLVALMPAGIFALTTSIKANKMAWQGFGDAAKDNSDKANKALAKLPPEAQKAALAMRGVAEEIQRPVAAAFWEKVGTSLQDMVKAQLPSVIRGMSDIGSAWGSFTKEVFNSVKNLGDFNDVFGNVATGVRNMIPGINNALEGLARFVGTGSRFLPAFGTYAAGLGEKFGAFAAKAQESGKMMEWIQVGTRRLQELGSVISSTTGILGGLIRASQISGASGLTQLADGLANIRDTVQGEPFQSKLIAVLEGARSGTDALGDGFQDLSRLIGNSTQTLSEFLETTGQIGGTALTSMTKLFDGTGLGSGLLTALYGLQDALVVLEPGFHDLGKVIGDLGEIAGTLFTSMAPGLNNLLSTVAGVIAGLKDGVIAAMPVFNNFFQALFTLASGPIVALAEGIGNLLKIFANMPGPIQTVIITLGLLVAMRGKITGLFTGIQTAFANMRGGVEANAGGLSKSVQNMQRHFGNAATSMSSVGNAIRNIPFAAATSGIGGIGTAAGGALRSLGSSAASGLRGALSGGAALLGGPWGIALGGAIALASAFGEAQAESAAKVKALSDTLDQQSGTVTAVTRKMLATNALDGATNGFDDFVRGVLQGSASVEETLRDLGISTKEYTDRLADPSGRDAFTHGLDEITMALKLGKPVTEEMAAAVGSTKEELAGISGTSMAHLATKARDAAGELSKAEQNVRSIAEATGTNTAQATILARNYEVLASATSSASDKFSALKQNLDIVTGGMRTIADSQQAAAQSTLNTSAAFAKIKEDTKGATQALYSIKDGFNFASQAGLDLRTAVSGSVDSILQLGTASLDQALKAGKSTADAQSIAIQAMQPGVASLRSQLSSLGLAQPQIDSIIRSFGLMPDQIATAIDVTGTEEAQRKILLVKLAGDAFANGNYTSVLAALPEPAKAAIAEATGTADAWKNKDYTAILEALDQTAPGKEAALAQILSVTNGDYKAVLKALDITADPVASAKAQANSYKNADYTADLEAVNRNLGPVANARAQALGYKNADYTAQLEALNRNMGPVANARAQALGYKNADYTANIEARNLTAGPVSSASGALRSVPDILRNITARDFASGPAFNAQSAIAGVQSKTVDVVVRYSAIGKPGINADGNIYPAINAYANGGISKFASGGMMNFNEQHVAQIARGAWPARLWAEPETGGEAYIPLALSKRLRSLKILQQVAEMFGFSLMKKFADGGFMSSMTPQATSSASNLLPSSRAISSSSTTTAQTPTIIVNVYPPAGMDTTAVGKSVVQELNWQIQSNA